jgi:hypothetical protein
MPQLAADSHRAPRPGNRRGDPSRLGREARDEPDEASARSSPCRPAHRPARYGGRGSSPHLLWKSGNLVGVETTRSAARAEPTESAAVPATTCCGERGATTTSTAGTEPTPATREAGGGKRVSCEKPSTGGDGGGNCTAGYSPCIPPGSDVDCAGGSGNGPRYVDGPVYITGSDPYGLDADGDGVGCE